MKPEILSKNEKEVLREFETEEWGTLLHKVKEINAKSIEQVDNLYFGDEIKEVDFDGELREMNLVDFISWQKSRVLAAVLQRLDRIQGISEYGSGYGSKLIFIFQHVRDRIKTFNSFDISESGLKIQKHLLQANTHKIFLEKVKYDQEVRKIEADLNNHLLYTFQSLHYWPLISKDFFAGMRSKGVNRLLLFEPVFEYQDENKYLFNQKQNYMKANNYCLNLLTVVAECRKLSIFNDYAISKPLFGINPLLPVHLIDAVYKS